MTRGDGGGHGMSFMSGRIFLDTNVLLHALDRREKGKQSLAREVIGDLVKKGEPVISTQVVQEAYVGATKKLGVAPHLARRWVEQLQNFEVLEIGMSHIQQAIDCAILNQLSFWDGLIVVAAEAAQCLYLYTEDMNSGQIIRGVKLVNPFT